MFFISYAKNFFVPPSHYGIGSPRPIRSFPDALQAATAGRHTIALIHNGYTGGQIENVVNKLANMVTKAGRKVRILEDDEGLATTCRSSLRGVTACYGAASFHGSPSEGAGIWNYTLRADGVLGRETYVDQDRNDAEIYILPFQHAIDSIILSVTSEADGEIPSEVNEYPFTSETGKQRERRIQMIYMNSIIKRLGVAFYIGIVGVTYQLTGLIASEREIGLSQLIEAMSPLKTWETQAARLLSTHFAFDIIYLPSWIIMSVIVARLVFPSTSVAIVLFYHILAGLSLASFSVLGGSLFRKAQLSGIIVTISSILLAIIAQLAGPFSTSVVAVLSILFPPMNYVFFIIYLAHWEYSALPADLAQSAPRSGWTLPGIVFWIFLGVQTLALPPLGAIVENTLYGTASKNRKVLVSSPGSTIAVRLKFFTKHYRPNWWQRNTAKCLHREPKETVRAVSDLSFDAIAGQILVLLGANGSGKSTTLNALTGLTSITSGVIELDGGGGVGYCPQKNVMWDDLTCEEHVKIFNSIKGYKSIGATTVVMDLIKACDLEGKAHARSKTLSGGQKRKLQLAMMFAGGSRVCCVDEVSSGLDPLSRRKIWDILLAQRGSRTLLLTTHFLDEADVLADDIILLSKGVLKATGSAAELKHRFGGGYKVHVKPDAALGQVQQDWHRQTPSRVVYRLGSSVDAARFVSQLECRQILDYQIQGPTIEDVFLKLADEMKEEEEKLIEEAIPSAPPAKDSGSQSSSVKGPAITEELDETVNMANGGATGILEQTWILFRKRLTILRRHFLPYIASVLVPVVTAALVTLFLKDFRSLSCSPGAQSSNPQVSSIQSFPASWNLAVPIGPANDVSIPNISNILGVNESVFYLVDSLEEFNEFVSTSFTQIAPGGIFLEENRPPLIAYIGNWRMEWSIMTQSLADSILAGVPIFTSFQKFATPFDPDAGKSMQLILYFGLAMSAYPGFFALYPTLARIRKVHALHYSNGVRSAPLWMAYTLFDFLFVLVVSALAIIIFATTSDVWYHPAYLFVVFFLYGLTSILLAYVVSLFVNSQLASFAFATGGQAAFFMLYFIIYMCILTYSEANVVDRDLTIAHFAFGLITPSGNLLRAMLLALNEFSILCRGHSIASYPGELRAYGGPILYLVGQTLILFAFLLWWDDSSKSNLLTRFCSSPADEEQSFSSDPDVLAEVRRVESTPSDGLRALHLTKYFGKNKAVDDVTFGIRHGEVFSLLGPNGAGKSTTISLIRGDSRPSAKESDILVEQASILSHNTNARRHLSVCPQFDAIDPLTVYEHLVFYAQIRGIAEPGASVEAVLQAVGLESSRYRMASKLSGGNKRKLSLAISLMGNPSVLLLDEPSSGMDAAAKRMMWRTLQRVRPGRALLITTHSMEEADALATRVGIMARRMLALGEVERLRARWGDAWVVQGVLKGALRTEAAAMDKAKRWVDEHISGVVWEGEVLHGQLRFRVPRLGNRSAVEAWGVENGSAKDVSGQKFCGMSTPELFALLESGKEGVGVEYYSISQTTLDQVFLRIVGEHDVQGEDNQQMGRGREKKPRWKVFGMG